MSPVEGLEFDRIPPNWSPCREQLQLHHCLPSLWRLPPPPRSGQRQRLPGYYRTGPRRRWYEGECEWTKQGSNSGAGHLGPPSGTNLKWEILLASTSAKP